jgi:energy-coupling factor transporter ATP-binding protein EcfA2
MFVRRLQLEHFKGLPALNIDFLRESGTLRPLTLLLGANGSGKTSVLQAVALVLALTTRKIAEPARLTWPGFLLERIGSGGRTRISLELGFEADELAATSKLFEQWRHVVSPRVSADVAPPSAHPTITVRFEDGALTCDQGDPGLAQCFGRYFIRTIVRTNPDLRRQFARVGDVFWFDQQRNLLTSGVDDNPGGIEALRHFLITWYAYHASPHQPGRVDYLKQLETQFARIFPGTRFAGVEPRPGTVAADSYFLLQRDGRTYDLSEMSSGEQAVFPLIYEFVRLDIARSVVMIDELELHLHPPEQQLCSPACGPSVRTVSSSSRATRRTSSPPCPTRTRSDSEAACDACSPTARRRRAG